MAKVSANRQVLNFALKSLIQRLEKTEKFVLDNAPDVCKQMVKASVIEALELGIGALILFGMGLTMFLFSWSHDLFAQTHDPDPTRYFYGMVLGGIAATIGFFMASNAIGTLLYVKQCTKLFLLREFRDLVSNSKKEE